MAQEDKVFDLDNIPDDAQVSTKKKEFDPIDPSQIYQVEVSYVQLKENPFYRADEKDPTKMQSKYQFSFEFTILNEGEFYGRRMWDATGMSFNPGGKRGPTKLYKIVMAALKKEFDWDECDAYAPDTKTFLENLLVNVKGKQVKVGVESIKKDDGGVRTKITAYHQAKEELPAYDPKNSATEVDKKIAAGEEIKEEDLPF